MKMAGKVLPVPHLILELPIEVAARLAEFKKAMKAAEKISKVPSMVHLLLPTS
jgi:hypothetical protein